MQYYSDKTKRLYQSESALKSAEIEYDKKQKEIDREKQERAKAAQKVEEARVFAENAKKAYEEALSQFVNKYGNTTAKSVDGPSIDLHEFFKSLFF